MCNYNLVGQLEGACDARADPGKGLVREWAQWRRDFEKTSEIGLQGRVASEWKTKVRRAVAQALGRDASRSPSGVIWRDRVAGPYCVLFSWGEETVVKSSEDLATFLRRSTWC